MQAETLWSEEKMVGYDEQTLIFPKRRAREPATRMESAATMAAAEKMEPSVPEESWNLFLKKMTNHDLDKS